MGTRGKNRSPIGDEYHLLLHHPLWTSLSLNNKKTILCQDVKGANKHPSKLREITGGAPVGMRPSYPRTQRDGERGRDRKSCGDGSAPNADHGFRNVASERGDGVAVCALATHRYCQTFISRKTAKKPPNSVKKCGFAGAGKKPARRGKELSLC